MNNFRAIAVLDIFAVTAQLFKLNPAKWLPVEARGEINNAMFGLGASLLLRAHKPITKQNWLDDLPVYPTADLEKWPSMTRLLERCRKAVMAEPTARQYLDGTMARAMVSRLDPGSTIFWHIDDGPYHAKTVRFHLPLVTNPGCLLYSGSEVMHIESGVLIYFNNKIRHSAANWGQQIRLHLIFEMRLLDKEQNGEPE